MSVLASELVMYGCAVMSETDATENIGGAIDTSKKLEFFDWDGGTRMLSMDAGDDANVTLTYRDAAGVKQTEVQQLNGQSPVAFTATPERVLKAVKAASCAGDVVVEKTTAELTGTAQAGAAETVTLPAGASAVDDAYLGMVVQITSGTGANQARMIIRYNGTTKVATVNRVWATPPDATSGVRVSKGLIFDKLPAEIMTVQRPFYEAAANGPGGDAKVLHEKVCLKNTNGSTDLTNAVVKETLDPSGLLDFGVGTIDGTATAANRLTAPAGVTFNGSDKAVPGGGVLGAGEYIEVWLRLTLAAGAAAVNSYYLPTLDGNTI
ncbi:MAG: hypothetical protein ACE147_00675 [Candidatus Methylomirabilales bacterium]